MKRIAMLSVLILAGAVFFDLKPNNSLAINPGFIDPDILQGGNSPQIDFEAVKKFQEARCNRMQARIEEQNTKLEKNKERHMNSYNNLKSRYAALIAKLDARGYDTTQLERDQAKLEEKVSRFSEDYADHAAKLREAKGYVCGNTTVNAKAKMGEVREALNKVKADAQDIGDFYKEEIRAHIKDLKKQDV